MTLWSPRRAERADDWSLAAARYVTASEILGDDVAYAERVELWRGVPLGQALNLLASMLRDQDLAEGDVRTKEAGWVNAGLQGNPRRRCLSALAQGHRVLAPQLLLVAMKEALLHCPQGPAREDHAQLPEVMRAVLGVAEQVGDGAVGEARWGSLPTAFAADLIANQYFNHASHPVPLLAAAQELWREDWPATAVKSERRTLGTPAELFLSATGLEYDDYAGLAVHFWVQATMHNFIRFPPDFFGRLGIPDAAVNLALDSLTLNLQSLREAIPETPLPHENPWDFAIFRRKPVVRLDDGSYLVLRLGYALDSALGPSVRERVLRHLAPTGANPRSDAFRELTSIAFEQSIGDRLARTFPGDGLFRRVFHESTMKNAWRGKGGVGKLCDWAVDCGDLWVCVEVTERRLPEAIFSGTATNAELDAELDRLLLDRKFEQLASTIKNLRNRPHLLTRGSKDAPLRFVPLIVTPSQGLPWNPAVSDRVSERLRSHALGKKGAVTPVALVSDTELGYLESAAERGANAGRVLWDWRAGGSGLSLEQFMYQRLGLRLGTSTWEANQARRVMDDLIARQESHGAEG